jgi:hypothetical protein
VWALVSRVCTGGAVTQMPTRAQALGRRFLINRR